MDQSQDEWIPCFNPQKSVEQMLAEYHEYWRRVIEDFKRKGLITDKDLEKAEARRRRKASRKRTS